MLSVFAAKSVHSGPWRWSGGLTCGTETTNSSPVWTSVLQMESGAQCLVLRTS